MTDNDTEARNRALDRIKEIMEEARALPTDRRHDLIHLVHDHMHALHERELEEDDSTDD